MSKIGDGIGNFLQWVYGLKPDTVQQYEFALIGYVALLLHLNLSASQQAAWGALGFAAYGVLRAIYQILSTYKSVKGVQ